MAINKRRPHVYDAEYVAAANIREVKLFNRGQSTNIQYTDAAAAVINRSKGFEDTNLTEDGRVNECGMIVDHLGVRIVPGPGVTAIAFSQDVAAFYERGYAELILNDNTVAFTARIKDLVPESYLEIAAMTTVAATTLNSATLKGRMLDVGGIEIPQGVRFQLSLKWERALSLPSALCARIEAAMTGRPLGAGGSTLAVPSRKK